MATLKHNLEKTMVRKNDDQKEGIIRIFILIVRAHVGLS